MCTRLEVVLGVTWLMVTDYVEPQLKQALIDWYQRAAKDI